MDMLHIYGLPSFSRGIRKKAVSDLHMQLRPPATTKHPIQYHSLLRTTVCGGYAFPQPAGGRRQKTALRLFPHRGTLPKNCYKTESRID